MKRFILIIAIAMLSLTGCQEQVAKEQAPEVTSLDSSGQIRAYRDPVTGELTSPPEDEIRRQNLEASTMGVQTDQPVEMIPLEGGGYKAPLGDRFQMESTATVQPDGSIVIKESLRQPE